MHHQVIACDKCKNPPPDISGLLPYRMQGSCSEMKKDVISHCHQLPIGSSLDYVISCMSLRHPPDFSGPEKLMRARDVGVRVDTWVETGTEISPFYDSLIGKLMVHAETRSDAIKKMLKALSNTRLGGIPNNLEYHKTILSAEGYASGSQLSRNLYLLLRRFMDPVIFP